MKIDHTALEYLVFQASLKDFLALVLESCRATLVEIHHWTSLLDELSDQHFMFHQPFANIANVLPQRLEVLPLDLLFNYSRISQNSRKHEWTEKSQKTDGDVMGPQL